MNFGVDYNDSPKIVKHGICCRCERPSENSPIGTGRVPTGPGGALESIKNIVLCLDCVALMAEIPKKFWHEGWPNQNKKK